MFSGYRLTEPFDSGRNPQFGFGTKLPSKSANPELVNWGQFLFFISHTQIHAGTQKPGLLEDTNTTWCYTLTLGWAVCGMLRILRRYGHSNCWWCITFNWKPWTCIDTNYITFLSSLMGIMDVVGWPKMTCKTKWTKPRSTFKQSIFLSLGRLRVKLFSCPISICFNIHQCNYHYSAARNSVFYAPHKSWWTSCVHLFLWVNSTMETKLIWFR